MSKQREAPRPASAVAWLAMQKAKKGGHYTGGEIENFREGWALPLGHFGKAHYFERYCDVHLSACGFADHVAGRVFAPNDWPKCKTCLRLQPNKERK